MIEQSVELVGADSSITAMIHLDDRGHGTPEEAVGLFESEALIRRRLARLDSQALLQGVQQCETALDAAAYAGAHPNQAVSRFD